VYTRHFLQGFHHIYGHIQRIYTVLANPTSQQVTDSLAVSLIRSFDFPAGSVFLSVNKLP
jgi:hypothetical protein